jgi:hypothetical protein
MTAVATAPLRALTVRQPYPDAIILGSKKTENRSWPIPAKHVGTRVLIHAGAAPKRRAVLPEGVDTSAWPGTLGVILAVATLAGCHFDAGCCRPWGFAEVFHWQLVDVRPLAVPVPAKGALGFWTPGDDVLTAVQAQTGEAS